MKITRRSPMTQQMTTREIDVTTEQLIEWRQGALIQDAMPRVSKADREFIMTGATAADWDEAFQADVRQIKEEE